MNRLRPWLSRNLDVLLFAGALSSVGPLMGWWSVLVRRNIVGTDQLLRAQISSSFDGPALEERLAALDAATARQLLMITGESTLAGVMLFVLVFVLAAVARHRRQETQRLQTMLQLTTHQLKTPLAGVRALLQSLGNGSIPLELHPKFIGQGVAECDRLEHLVETMLAYQRAVGRQLPRSESLSTRVLVEGILDHRRATFPDDEVEWAPGPSCSVTCDRDAVRVVLKAKFSSMNRFEVPGGA
jgi:signal transduction histidine kinase